MENNFEIRNFVIIAHIDHGKSTLADRFLELTGTIPQGKMKPQYLDMMDLERERGVTIKLQPVRMEYRIPSLESKIENEKSKIQNSIFYILNLVDTPGHVDFNYEVSRALAAVEGAILLVDATKGIQAQTLANLDLAQKQNLVIIPTINKIDSPQAKVQETKEELSSLLKINQDEIFEISAKTGKNVDLLLSAVLKKIPPPRGNPEKPFRALIFDSKYDAHKGIIAFIRVFDGKIKNEEKIYLINQKTEGKVKEAGFFKPELTPANELKAGEIGYIATGIKEPGRIRVGETITNFQFPIINHQTIVEPLSGYQEPKAMIFASVYPENPDDFELLKQSLAKLKLNDPSLTFEPESKLGLGRGFRCGFLGTFHIEIIAERLKREFGLNLVISTPSVVYKIIDKNDKENLIYSASEWPEPSKIKETLELWIKLEVITPLNYIGGMAEILKNIQGSYLQTQYLTPEKVILTYEVPLRKIITGFYDDLKNVSQGYASMNYEILSWKKNDLIKLEILIAGKKEEAFSKIVSREESFEEGKKLVSKLKEVLPGQLFSVPIQATIEGKIIARETIKAKRRDVIAPLYGGDYTRKRKLLEKQKKGKKELKEKAKIQIPSKVFLEVFKSR